MEAGIDRILLVDRIDLDLSQSTEIISLRAFLQ